MTPKAGPEAPVPRVPVSPGYRAAVHGAAVIRQRSRRFLSVEGVGPEQMLKGILSGKIPEPLVSRDGPWLSGTAARSAVLTPKGKMITDLRISPMPGGGFLLDLPAAGIPGVLAHFKKFINPRFATVTDATGDLGMLTVVGPGGADVLGSVLRLDRPLPGEEDVLVRLRGEDPDLFLLSNVDVLPPALDLMVPLSVLEEIRGRLEDQGARALSHSTWEVLRIEAGTPAFGVDMTEDTIPVEAGIEDRVIDYGKGCYTGQEVIIRLRDRGRVSKHFRRLLLGDAEPPLPGTRLFPCPVPSEPGSTRASDPSPGVLPAQPSGGEGVPNTPGQRVRNHAAGSVGWITSACASPRFDQTVALGYLKRSVEPGERVAVGEAGGPSGVVEALP